MTREQAIDIIKCLAWHTRPDEEDVEQAIKALEQESRKGHWIPYLKEGLIVKCSECESRFSLGYNYCPNCGADMRAESEDKE